MSFQVTPGPVSIMFSIIYLHMLSSSRENISRFSSLVIPPERSSKAETPGFLAAAACCGAGLLIGAICAGCDAAAAAWYVVLLLAYGDLA